MKTFNCFENGAEVRLGKIFVLLALIMIVPGAVSSQLTKLTFDDLSLNGHFGREFDIHTDYIVVAEPNFSDTSAIRKGRTHVFNRQGDLWVHDGILDNTPTKPYSHFGHDLSMHNGALVVSAPDITAGRVYSYLRTDADWQLTQELTIPIHLHRESPHTRFGENVELHDGWLAVSAPGYLGTAHPVTRTGAVFIYKKEGADWAFHQMILPPDLSKSTQFGNVIEISSSAILISAVKGDGGSTQSGVVYLYRLEGNSWVSDYTFINPSSKPHELFGADVAMHEDIIVIGVPMHTEDMSKGPYGAAHVYQRFGNTWIRTAFLEASDGKRNDMFGAAVTVENGNILIGAPRHDEPGKSDAGKVYHYVVQSGIWSEKTTYSANAEDLQAHMHFGSALRLHENQLVISSHLMNNGLEDSGIAYVTDIEGTTGTDENPFPSSHLFIHPNPVEDVMHWTVEGDWGPSMLITIYSADGHAVVQREISNHGPTAQSIDVSELMPGMYFLHANDSGKVSIHKWMKI